MAVLGHTPFQFMQTHAQLLLLLPQLLVLCSELPILLPKRSVLLLKVFDQFLRVHDSILIVQVKGALYSHDETIHRAIVQLMKRSYEIMFHKEREQTVSKVWWNERL